MEDAAPEAEVLQVPDVADRPESPNPAEPSSSEGLTIGTVGPAMVIAEVQADNADTSAMQVDVPPVLEGPPIVVESAPIAAPLPPSAAPAVPKPFWVDFDLMQNKLMDKDSGYLTLRSFLRDIERLAENVNMMDDDTDRRAKAHAMLVEAKLMLKDHFQDEQQKAEMERMAAREYAKREVLKRKDQSADARETSRSASMLPDEPREGDQTLRKRQRQPSEAASGDDSNTHARKRSRLDGALGEVPPPQSGSTFAARSFPTAEAGPSSSTTLNHFMEARPAATGPSTDGHAVGSNGLSSVSTAVESALSVRNLINPIPVPVQHPDFIVPEDGLQLLRIFLIDKTSDLNVEELEQLRAMCLQRIWKDRRKWDRSLLVVGLIDLVKSYILSSTGAESF